ncbi:hypothetical protein AB1K62_02950 [Parasphingorhabdus sp. JC815]|uniref:hypothetical protein n=1 Tax=Parasphingorhabdus sp. JC815 TaxID=3232140 RepID=UPI00345ADD51
MNDTPFPFDPLHRLIIAYAKRSDRLRHTLVFALDNRLADIIRSTSETLIGQMRLTWWWEILTKTITQRPVGEPLVALINEVEEQGADFTPLLSLLEGWEYLLDDFPWDDRQFDQYAMKRGEGVFAFARGGYALLTSDQKTAAQAWALWDFARHCSDTKMRAQAFVKCRQLFQTVSPVRFDRNGRALSILCKLVERDVTKKALTADLYQPVVASKVVWHGMTGC